MSIFSILKELGLASNNTTSLFYKGTRDNPNIDIYRDKNSGVIFIKDYYVGDENYLKAEYKKKELKKESNNEVSKDYERVNDCARRVKNLSPFYIKKDIVDFGCGEGDFLYEIKELAKSLTGIELEIDCIKKLSTDGIKCGKSLKIVDDKSIDTFFLFHSFEHLPKPLETLKEIKTKLKNRGKIIIEVPHANDFLISTLEHKSFLKFTFWSQHLILHTELSLRRFLEYAGFQNIMIKGIQRYPLSNHLQWISENQPGGHKSKLAFLETEALTESYASALSSIGVTDTLVAIAES